MQNPPGFADVPSGSVHDIEFVITSAVAVGSKIRGNMTNAKSSHGRVTVRCLS